MKPNEAVLVLDVCTVLSNILPMEPTDAPQLRFVLPDADEDVQNLRFPRADEHQQMPAEMGVTERSVAKCAVAIQECNLDLGACISKGGSWAVAAQRIQEAQRRGYLQKFFDTCRELETAEMGPVVGALLKQLANYGVGIEARIADSRPSLHEAESAPVLRIVK